MVDESTPWVVHYRGLWGNDTRDPLGGERGPAGPRYERSTMVRGAWGDPVGWAGLRKVAPDAAAAADALRARLDELDTEVERLDSRIEQLQIAQRAVVASGERVSDPDDAELVALAADRVALRDQQLLLGDRQGRSPTDAGPHDHLRHRRVPLPTETTSRRRVLAIWSAISTSIVMAALIFVLVAPEWNARGLAVEVIIVLFAFEALARKQLVRFAVLVVASLLIAALLLALGSALVADWRVVLAFLLGVAAVALLFLNVRELVRD